MSRHRAPHHNQKPGYHLQPDRSAVWLQSGQPDPDRQDGVPDRIVISLHREGTHYVGKLVSWEYREIEVRRRTDPDGELQVFPEMIVDASAPKEHELVFEVARPLSLPRAITGLIALLECTFWPF